MKSNSTSIVEEKRQHPQVEMAPSPEFVKMDISILVVEDERINYRLLEVMLNKMGARVEQAVNGQVAIDLILKNYYDLVFMDMHMPVMGGLEATKILKGLYPRLPIIALTASMLTEDITSTLEAGCDSFMFKPTKRDLLKEVIIKYASC